MSKGDKAAEWGGKIIYYVIVGFVVLLVIGWLVNIQQEHDSQPHGDPCAGLYGAAYQSCSNAGNDTGGDSP